MVLGKGRKARKKYVDSSEDSFSEYSSSALSTKEISSVSSSEDFSSSEDYSSAFSSEDYTSDSLSVNAICKRKSFFNCATKRSYAKILSNNEFDRVGVGGLMKSCKRVKLDV